jgi:hypothetical protein
MRGGEIKRDLQATLVEPLDGDSNAVCLGVGRRGSTRSQQEPRFGKGEVASSSETGRNWSKARRPGRAVAEAGPRLGLG